MYEDGICTLAVFILVRVIISMQTLPHGSEVLFSKEESHECSGQKVIGSEDEEQERPE